MSAIFTILSFRFSARIMMFFTDSPETITIGAEYLRTLSFSFVFNALATVYVSALRSIGKVVFPSVTAVVSLMVNVFINSVFIFGLFGMPQLGVTGVAIGTVIARITEFVLCIMYSVHSEIKYRLRNIFSNAGVLTQDFIKICAPSIGNDLIWSLATAVFAVILGHMGDDIVAANAVAVMVVNIGAIAVAGCIVIVAIPLMALAAYVMKLPPIWVYFVMTLDELEKMPFVIIHFKKYQWMKNITRDFV